MCRCGMEWSRGNIEWECMGMKWCKCSGVGVEWKWCELGWSGAEWSGVGRVE